MSQEGERRRVLFKETEGFSEGAPLAAHRDMTDISFAHGELTGRIIQGFQQTYRELGSGFSERVCQIALMIVLRDSGLDVRIDEPLSVQFRGRIIGTFEADMVVNNTVLVEIKAGPTLEGYPQAQLLNYLKVAGGGVGLLVNFGRRPEHKRMVVGDPVRSLPLLQTNTLCNLRPAGCASRGEGDNEKGGSKQP